MFDVSYGKFEWDSQKEFSNIEKHGIDFQRASMVFLDKQRIIAKDEVHSKIEERYFCIGKYENEVITVRFTMRKQNIRIIGAGKWRKGTKLYEKESENV
jgi:uncharacterized DUF497 family protein